MRSFKNVRLLRDGCCCLNDKGIEILFRVDISPPLTTIARLDGAGHWLGLTPIDFFLCGHLKALIYTSPVDSEEDLIASTVEAAATTRQQPGVFERTHQSLLRRCRQCIEVGGRTFEHLL
jgi:hypothetical protein